MRNFGRVIEIMTNDMRFSSTDFTMEGTVPFDDDPLPNESELKLWNLSNRSIQSLKLGKTLTVNAGYGRDVGVILQGFVSKVTTETDGVNRITTIHVLDSEDFSKRAEIEKTYTSGTLASYILRDMAESIGLKIAQFELVNDFLYVEGFTAKGAVTQILTDVATDCQTAAYINKGKLYIRNLKKGKDDVFRLSADTGLIGSPSYFNENEAKGYQATSQLQYRLTTASIIELRCNAFEGKLFVRKGSHRFSNTGDFKTEVEAVM
ncbi:hypothetical protein I6N90_02610 [Paenibacillus sp. GSMTC-2017]|uniref:phage protein n=1 Tax=Paenibacillus sp. GSMTC-2017 TaxID=2794350 RepID=UPI0018D6B0B7|nr:hypothetical protein [Paenibacillus sp. GSMTC-2017]MBH5316700.1 hypothetical protein [Paenibacillus sp. GSMTC-2017]